MANTQDILDRCSDLASATFPEAGGGCTARDAAIYLAHTERGESLRALAQATGTHPSTVMRTVRRVEARRDDPLVDSMLAGLERRAQRTDDTPPPANGNRVPDTAPPELPPELPPVMSFVLTKLTGRSASLDSNSSSDIDSRQAISLGGSA